MIIKAIAFAVVVFMFLITRSCYGRSTKRSKTKSMVKKDTRKNIDNQTEEDNVDGNDKNKEDIKHRFKVYSDGIDTKMDAKRVEFYFNDIEGIYAKCDRKNGVLVITCKRNIEKVEIESIAKLADIKITKIEGK